MELRIEDNDKPDSVPDYFNVVHEYKKIRIGHISNPRYIVDVRDYDYYIAAGVEKNEMFSKLVMMNMGVKDGCAVDSNTNTVSLNFPANCRFIRGDVSHQNGGRTTNLRYFVERYNDMFMKMNIGGREYMWVLTIPSAGLRKFKQMVIVFHDINNNPSKERAINKINCFKKLTKTHNIAHLVYDNGDVTITYIRKDDASGAIINSETSPLSKIVPEDDARDHSHDIKIDEAKENSKLKAEEQEKEREREREMERVKREAEEYEKARREEEEQQKERARRQAENEQWMREEAEKWKQQHGNSTLEQLSAVEAMLQQEEERRIRQEEEQQENERKRIQMEREKKKEEAIKKKEEEESKIATDATEEP